MAAEAHVNGIGGMEVVDNDISSDEKYVLPSSYSETFDDLNLYIKHGKPVLLTGSVGCGKSALLHHVARKAGRFSAPELITIQLCKDIDGKALLGSYHCTEVAGEFKWLPGLLTTAVMKSSWVILEDLDCAPADVISILLPLIQKRKLTVTELGKTFGAEANFRVFATLRTNDPSLRLANADLMIASHFKRLHLEPLTQLEILTVAKSLFPSLDILFPRLVAVYERITHTSDLDFALRRLLVSRMFSLRDFLKLCHRISRYFRPDLMSSQNNDIFRDVFLCFCAFIPDIDRRSFLAKELGALLHLSNPEVTVIVKEVLPTRNSAESFVVGRTEMKKLPEIHSGHPSRPEVFSLHHSAGRLLASLASIVVNNEACLLVGETGTGKTSVVQFLARTLNRNLHALNLSHQSESCDLLGGYKPVDPRLIISALRDPFLELFSQTYSKRGNEAFVSTFLTQFSAENWGPLSKTMRHITEIAQKDGGKKKGLSAESSLALKTKWATFSDELSVVEKQLHASQKAMLFSFLEGTLVKAYRSGDWVLLDEVNLANPELLSSLHNFVDPTSKSFILTDRGGSEVVYRHPDFRLFACMNPATDIGKKDLPANIRDRFTEIYCDALSDPSEVRMVVEDYLRPLQLGESLIEKIVGLYFKLSELAETKLIDGVSHRPHYSLRTYTQALKFAARNRMGNNLRSICEGFFLSYLTQLNRQSQALMKMTIENHLLGTTNRSLMTLPVPRPTSGNFEPVENYWLPRGSIEPFRDKQYITTKTVKHNLTEIARAISAGQLPVLLQGETSIGKTSMITYLAKLTGNPCVRINNHEHTDLEDYLGSYQTNEAGKLVFQEGILVNAVRKGHWIILDELNLAPSDVLEALNRLLDSNRELFIAETQTVVRAHPNFMLFATQNPPGYYGGRKSLSRAFRNRFIEMHFDEIPPDELQEILQKRCDLPETYAKKMIAVMLELQAIRKNSGVFAGKQGFMTLRDLFRWADRYRLSAAPVKGFYDFDQHLADHGFFLLSGRVRKFEETDTIRRTLEKHFRRTIDLMRLFEDGDVLSSTSQKVLRMFMECDFPEFEHIVWTSNMKRLAVLAGNALAFGEPILLVGETGCGKTTMCQIYAMLRSLRLFDVNCHVNTETSDFLGGLRPARSEQDSGKLFEWKDGSLVEAMRNGGVFLLDEISLAEDSVIERVNSVLEPERSLVLTEKRCASENQKVDELIAHPDFRFVATMNPGGDFGKKELSPALRNRFTEIWCNNLEIPDDAEMVFRHNLFKNTKFAGDAEIKETFVLAMRDFVIWHRRAFPRILISSRDIISWIRFINHCLQPDSSLNMNPFSAYFHGALMVFETLNAHDMSSGNARVSSEILQFLVKQARSDLLTKYFSANLRVGLDFDEHILDTENRFGVHPFSIPKYSTVSSTKTYSFESKSVRHNLLRILRGLTVAKAVLLEGSPGVGKTSIVCALAAKTGNKIVRINLSEQTDVSELFGSDMPTEGESAVFSWRDGPFLQALKDGSWILLDELNLASQSVLEGLNACLDHRGEIFIPELGRTFKVDSDRTRIFGCQNPVHQGAGRKGLPKSFLNRFTQVYMEVLSDDDLLAICQNAFPHIRSSELKSMLLFNDEIQRSIQRRQLGTEGQPWEFNLRDVMRWCELITTSQDPEKLKSAFVELLYVYRFRTPVDQAKVRQMAVHSLSLPTEFSLTREFVNMEISKLSVQIGEATLPLSRASSAVNPPTQMLQSQSAILEKLVLSAQHNFVSILVGGHGSGKTTLVESLAALSGNRLDVMNMNSSTDAGELLGGFEQWSNERRRAEIVETCGRMAELVSDLSLGFRTLLLKLGNTVRNETVFRSLCADTLTELEMPAVWNAGVAPYSIDRLKHQLNRYMVCENSSKGSFEWSDSIIVKALLDGSWLLVENANLCSPAVLDRLNSVLEPDGQLVLSERGAINGSIAVIKAHPHFRLFLTMNPKYGELSRAMRNRAIEIFVSPPFHPRDGVALVEEFGLSKSTSLALRDVFAEIGRTQKLTLKDTHEIAQEVSMRGQGVDNLLQNSDIVKAVARCTTLDVTQELAARIDHTLSCRSADCSHSVMSFPVLLRSVLDEPLSTNALRHQNSLATVWLTCDNIIGALIGSTEAVQSLRDAVVLPVMLSALDGYFNSSSVEEWHLRTSLEGLRNYEWPSDFRLLLSAVETVFKDLDDAAIDRHTDESMDVDDALVSFDRKLHLWIRLVLEWGLKTAQKQSSRQLSSSLEQFRDFFAKFEKVVNRSLDVVRSTGLPDSVLVELGRAALWLRSVYYILEKNSSAGNDNSLLAILWNLFLKQVWKRFPELMFEAADPALVKRKRDFDSDFVFEYSKVTSKLRHQLPPGKPFDSEESYRKNSAVLGNDVYHSDLEEDFLPGTIVSKLEKTLRTVDPLLNLRHKNQQQLGKVTQFWRLYHLGLILNSSATECLTSENSENLRNQVLSLLIRDYDAIPVAIREILFVAGLTGGSDLLNPLEYFSLLYQLLSSIPRSEHDLLDEESLVSGNLFLWNREITAVLRAGNSSESVSLGRLHEQIDALKQLKRVLWRTSAFDFVDPLRTSLLSKIFKTLTSAAAAVFPGSSINVTPSELFASVCDILPARANLINLEKKLTEQPSVFCTALQSVKASEMADEESAAVGWIFTGLAVQKMFFPPMMDPVQKAQIKRDCHVYQAVECQGSLLVTAEYFKNLYGTADERNYDSFFTEFHKSHLEKTEAILSAGNVHAAVYRPQPSMYAALVQDATFIRESVTMQAVECLEILRMGQSAENYKEIKSMLENSVSRFSSLTRLVEENRQKFLAYKDLTSLFLSGVHQVIFGMRLLHEIIAKKLTWFQLGSNDQSLLALHKILGVFAFGSPNSESYAEIARLIWTNRSALIKMLRPDLEEVPVVEIGLAVLTLGVIQQQFGSSTRISDGTGRLIHAVFARIAKLWTDLELKRRIAEAEKEQLYKFVKKPEVDSFPTFQEAFDDLFQIHDSEPETKKSRKKEFGLELQNEIVRLHNDIISKKSPTEAGKVFSEAHKILSEINLRSNGALGGQIASTFQLLQARSAEINLDSATTSTDKAWSFYQDANVEKTRSCIPVLMDVKSRMTELLEEWPSNPVLEEVVLVINRILSFDCTEPMAKFLAGLELLLTKCQNWEVKAHSGVSVEPQMKVLTEKILEWRRLELSEWKNSLKRVRLDKARKAGKWWPFVFTTVLECIESKNKERNDELIRILQNFVEVSSLGDFESRLELLKSVADHFGAVEPVAEETCCILRNIHGYYAVFIPEIEKKVSEALRPVETDLKNFVKIVRWDPDMKYWSLKHTVDKAHRRVLEFMRKFELALDSRVELVLMNHTLDPLVVRESFDWRILKTSVTSSGFLTSLPGLPNLPLFCRKSQKFVRQILRSLSYMDRVRALVDLADQAELRHKELKIEPPENLTKDKRKETLKVLVQRRRLAFTSLSKSLKEIGLSARKGMTLASMKNPNDSLAVPSIFSTNAGSHTELINSCQTEYYLNLINLDLFRKLAEKPNKSLPGTVLASMRGYVEHLHHIIIDNCRLASRTVNENESIRTFLMSVQRNSWKNVASALTNSQCRRLTEEAAEITSVILSTLEKYTLLMDSVPAGNDEDDKEFLNCIFGNPGGLDSSSAEWKKINRSFEKSTKIARNIMENFRSKTTLTVDGGSDFELLSTFLAGFTEIQTDLENISAILPAGIRPLLVGLCEQLKDFVARIAFSAHVAKDHDVDSMLMIPTGNMTKRLLKSIQDIVGRNKSALNWKKKELTESEVSNDKLLTDQLMKSLEADIEVLDLDRVLRSVRNFVRASQKVTPDIRFNVYLESIQPFFTAFSAMSDGFTELILVNFQASCRLLNILLGIFSDLVKNAFGATEEIDDELKAEGSAQFEETEQAGMGAGEGAKDVSEQIESQDQLEDTRKEGEEKKEEEAPKEDLKDEEHGIEMEEDFEGAMHDITEEEQKSGDESGDEEENPEVDDEMGDVDENQKTEQLDDELWKDEGGDDEDSGDDGEKDDKENSEADAKGKNDDKRQELAAGDSNANQEGTEEPAEDQPENDEMDNQTGNPDDVDTKEPQETDESKIPESMEIENESGDEENPDTEEMKEGEPEAGETEDESTEENQPAETGKVDEELAEDTETPQLPEADSIQQPSASASDQNEADGGTEGVGLPERGPDDQSSGTNNCEEVMADEKESSTAENQSNSGITADTSGQNTSSSLPQNSGHSRPKNIDKRSLEQTNPDKTSGDQSQSYKKRLKMSQTKNSKPAEKKSENDKNGAELFEHVKNENEQFDAQTVDAASTDEAVRNKLEKFQMDDEKEEAMETEDEPAVEESDLKTDTLNADVGKMNDKKSDPSKQPASARMESDEPEFVETPGDFLQTLGAARESTSSFHTQLSALDRSGPSEAEKENLRSELVEEMANWSKRSFDSAEHERMALELWKKYELVTQSYSYEMCEQLRLVLEPTKKTKLKGDYRTGKRLNMRKVVAYVASNFRKDKIWMRRSLPNQRQYQVMIAVDDSSSMADNRTKELAFESLALISNSLTLLEVGELSICSFGEKVELLHPFNLPFSGQDGARVLTKFSFQQKKTNLAEMLNSMSGVFDESRSRLTASSNVSQLLLIVSDGRGVFREGVEIVKKAIRRLINTGVFTVFVILDNPGGPEQSSILDIRVPVFGAPGQPLELKSYMQDFPFPFYLVLQDVKQLPLTLCDAVRQWFELIASHD